MCLKGGISIEEGISWESSGDVRGSAGIDDRAPGLIELTQIGDVMGSSVPDAIDLLNGGDNGVTS